MNNHDNRHDRKAIWGALSGMMVTVACAFSTAHADELAREPVRRLAPALTVAVSSAPSMRGRSVAYRT